MGAEAPQSVLVRPHLPQVDPQPIQIIEPPQVAALHQGAQPLHRRVKHQQMTRQDRDAGIGRGARHGLGVAHAQRERLLHEARLTRLDALPGEPRVGGRGRRDHDGVHPAEQVRRVAGDVRSRILACQPLPDLGVGVAHRRELAFRQRRRGADVVLAPHPGADHAEPEATHR